MENSIPDHVLVLYFPRKKLILDNFVTEPYRFIAHFITRKNIYIFRFIFTKCNSLESGQAKIFRNGRILKDENIISMTFKPGWQYAKGKDSLIGA